MPIPPSEREPTHRLTPPSAKGSHLLPVQSVVWLQPKFLSFPAPVVMLPFSQPLHRRLPHRHFQGSTTSVPAPVTVARDWVQPLAENLFAPINVDILEKKLSQYPNHDFSTSLVNTLSSGTDIGYTAPEKHQVSRDLISATQHPEVVSWNLTKEILFHWSGGFSLPLLYPSPVSPPRRG